MEDATCEKIILEIDKKIKADLNMNDFDIIPSNGQVNTSPVVYTNHALGLESWCVKHVYKYAYKRIFERMKEQVFHEPYEMLRWTQCCLLIVPEVTKFWNIRKKMFLKQYLTYERENLLTKITLTRKHKCLEAIQQRRWLLKGKVTEMAEFIQKPCNHHYVNESKLQMKLLLGEELVFCYNLAKRSNNNYHIWNHRLWTVNKLEYNIDDGYDLFVSDHFFLHYFIEQHVSEHSAMHYFIMLLDMLVRAHTAKQVSFDYINVAENTVYSLYSSELDVNRILIENFPFHESLFSLRRALLRRLHLECRSCSVNENMPITKMSLNSTWQAILNGELELIEVCISMGQSDLAKKHNIWLERILKNY